MPIFSKPTQGDVVHEILRLMMDAYHSELADAGVTVGVLFATPGENDDYALKLHGYPCAATIKITSYKDRVLGIADATITIDETQWDDFDEAERKALIDHELQHLALQVDKEGQTKTDDLSRPKLKMVLHDWQLGGFALVASRHKAASLEAQAFKEAYHNYRQLLLFDVDDEHPATVPVDGSRSRRATGCKSAASQRSGA